MHGLQISRLSVVPASERHEIPTKLDPVDQVVALTQRFGMPVDFFWHIHDTDLVACRRHELVRVFNCLKNEKIDRQIGDRRGRNAHEKKGHRTFI